MSHLELDPPKDEALTPEAPPPRHLRCWRNLRSVFAKNPLLGDAACSLAAALAAVVWVMWWKFAVSKDFLTSTISRKVIHCTSAPMFVLVWRFYSKHERAFLIAAMVPAVNVVKIYLTAASMATAISRTGDPQEVLRGPFLYTWVILACTLLGFRSTPAVVALTQMAVGDGLAEIVGRRFGTEKWYFNEDKSYAGSIAFIIGATIACIGILRWLGLVSSISRDLVARVGWISTVCALIEVLPAIGWIDDNLSVPIVGALLGFFLIKPTNLSSLARWCGQ